jgi:hypothetical protein
LTDAPNILARARSAVNAITEPHGVDQDAVMKAMDSVQLLKDEVRQLAGVCEAAIIRWIEENGDITVGDVRYYVGPEYKHKCVNVPAAVEAVLNATGGDMKVFCDCLTSQPFKPASTRKVLGEDTPLFETTTELDIKTGKPKRGLQRSDARF